MSESEKTSLLSAEAMNQIASIILNNLKDSNLEVDVEQSAIDISNALIPNLSKLRGIKGFQDPIDAEQQFCVVTFDPATNAQPNGQGIFSWVKPRRVFADEESAAEYASSLVKKDPHHSNFIVNMGQYFPVELNPHSKEVQEVEVQKNMIESISESIRNRTKEDKEKISEISQRTESLLEKTNNNESVDDNEDLLTKYKRYHEARMFNISRYMQALEMIQEGRKSIKKYRNFVSELDSQDPNLRKTYLKDWVAARKKTGFSVETNTNFSRYMEEDLEIPGVDIDLNVKAFEDPGVVSSVPFIDNE